MHHTPNLNCNFFPPKDTWSRRFINFMNKLPDCIHHFPVINAFANLGYCLHIQKIDDEIGNFHAEHKTFTEEVINQKNDHEMLDEKVVDEYVKELKTRAQKHHDAILTIGKVSNKVLIVTIFGVHFSAKFTY